MPMAISTRERGILFILVGPGGAGKTALMKDVLARVDNLRQLPTATTRPIRDGEKEGREHLFVDETRFRQMIHKNELLEYQEVTSNRWYGTPRASVETNLNAGKNLIADIEVMGAKALREAYPDDVILIFVTVPGETEEEVLNTLAERMEQRRDSTTNVTERLQRAKELELPYQSQCQHVIVNDNPEKAAQQLYDIIVREIQRNTVAQ